ncbi:MAG: hypothetical protein NTV52_02460 [Acidobacteria bacterium]|nr:hypothetical protein [Acidobacteriota bacterium]
MVVDVFEDIKGEGGVEGGVGETEGLGGGLEELDGGGVAVETEESEGEKIEGGHTVAELGEALAEEAPTDAEIEDGEAGLSGGTEEEPFDESAAGGEPEMVPLHVHDSIEPGGGEAGGFNWHAGPRR